MGQEDRFVEVHDSNVVETAEDVEVDIVSHEFQGRVERVVPHDLKVIDCYAVLLVPVQVLAHHQSEFNVHLHGWNVLVDHVQGGLIVTEGGHLIAELGDLVHNLPEG